MDKFLNLTVIMGVGVVIAFAVIFPISQTTSKPIPEIFGITQQRLPVDEALVPVLQENAENLEISAESALAIDMTSGKILFEKNSNKSWPPASLNKLMTAFVVTHTLSLQQIVTIGFQDTEVAQPRMGLFAGEQITIYNLLRGLLISSANDAGAALARVVTGSEERFVALMNEMAKNLGMNNTVYKNTTGFDEIGQLTTAEDISLLVQEFLKYPELAEIVSTDSTVATAENEAVRHWLTNTNKLLNQQHIKGVKTGFTDLAKGNLVILSNDPNTDGQNLKYESQILTIILGSENRELDSTKLVNWVFDSYDF